MPPSPLKGEKVFKSPLGDLGAGDIMASKFPP